MRRSAVVLLRTAAPSGAPAATATSSPLHAVLGTKAACPTTNQTLFSSFSEYLLSSRVETKAKALGKSHECVGRKDRRLTGYV